MGNASSYIVRRTQIYLGEQQAEQLDERASTRGATRSALIMEAIDSYLDADEHEPARLARFRYAVEATAGSRPTFRPVRHTSKTSGAPVGAS